MNRRPSDSRFTHNLSALSVVGIVLTVAICSQWCHAQETQAATASSRLYIKDLIPDALHLVETESRFHILGNAAPGGSRIVLVYGTSQLLMVVGEGMAFKTISQGKMFAVLETELQVSDGKLALTPNTIVMLHFFQGAEHTYLAKTVLDKYTFDPDPQYPLMFRVGTRAEGYVYCFGRGTVTNNTTGQVTHLGYEQTADRWLNTLKTATGKDREYAASALGYLGDEKVIPPLLDALHDSSAAVRRNAIEALGHLPLTDASRAALVVCCKGDDPTVSSVAMTSLAQHGDIGVPTLIGFLKEQKLRVTAVSALGISASPAAEKQLIALLLGTTEADDIRVAAADSLGGFSDQPAQDALLSATKDKTKNVRVNAINSLVQIGSKGCLERLTQLAKTDPDKDVREAAAKGAETLRKPPATNPSFEQTIK